MAEPIKLIITPVRWEDIDNDLYKCGSIQSLKRLWMKYLIWVYPKNKNHGQEMRSKFENQLGMFISNHRDIKFVSGLLFGYKHPDKNDVIAMMDDNTKNRYFLDYIKS